MSTEKKTYLDYLTDSSFQGVKRLFVFPFENNGVRNGHWRYVLVTVEIKASNVLIDGKNFLISQQKMI